ncbi:hypothetical protein DFH08DRAFT_828207 [Mycena albidolilacea]|uniref:Uncharacterized protein n=1 Tax=Mycena albidolilacea TaxID=1033008 RepID=A0AAD6YWN5_9AGAR|nr:hypothetical protein DFH08DRAFT_828207 [Mycena albidolilacea]
MANSMRTTSRKLYGDWACEVHGGKGCTWVHARERAGVYTRGGAGRGTAGMRAESARAVGEARAGEGCERVKSTGVQRASARWASKGRAGGANGARWVHDLRMADEQMRGARDSGGRSTGLRTRDAAGMRGGYDVRREGVQTGMRREQAGYGVRAVLRTARGGTHGCERTVYVQRAGVRARWVQRAQCSGRAAVGMAWNVQGHGGRRQGSIEGSGDANESAGPPLRAAAARAAGSGAMDEGWFVGPASNTGKLRWQREYLTNPKSPKTLNAPVII